MQASELIAIINSGGGWLAIFYIFFTSVLPKIAPTYARAINKHQTREDRLFGLIAETNTQNAKLAGALEGLTNEFRVNNRRLEDLEDNYIDCKMKQANK